MRVFSSAPTVDMLLERVYRHYPKKTQPDDPTYQTSEEHRRLVCVQQAAAKSCEWEFYSVPDHLRVAIDPEVQPVLDALGAWRPFAARWRREVSTVILCDDSNPWHDASYRYSALQPGYVQGSSDARDEVVCAVSILAPVYVIYSCILVPGENEVIRYSNFPSRYHVRIDKLCALAEEMFGFSRLSEDILLTPVPDRKPLSSNHPMSETTLMSCLFSTYP